MFRKGETHSQNTDAPGGQGEKLLEVDVSWAGERREHDQRAPDFARTAIVHFPRVPSISVDNKTKKVAKKKYKKNRYLTVTRKPLTSLF
jgi:hypothetical protein